MTEQLDLATLILTRKDQLSRQESGPVSFADLATRGGKDAHGIPVTTKGRVQQLAGGDISHWPAPATIRALARMLKVTEHTVILAAAVTLGFDPPNVARLVNLLPTADELSVLTDADHAAILGLIDHMITTRTAEFSAEQWALLWLTGEQQGIGATRSMGYGRYAVTHWERVA